MRHVGGAVEDAAEQAAGRVEHIGNVARGIGLELGLIAVAAPVTVKLKLKTVVVALIVMVAGELNQRHTGDAS